MKRFLATSVAALLCLPLTLGCERKAEVKDTKTVTTPEGETTTTTTKTTETSGENPPPADSQPAQPQ
jgi:hypothetical protein